MPVVAGLAALSPWLPRLSLLPGELCVLEGGTPVKAPRLAPESVMLLSLCCPGTGVFAFAVAVLTGEERGRGEEGGEERGRGGERERRRDGEEERKERKERTRERKKEEEVWDESKREGRGSVVSTFQSESATNIATKSPHQAHPPGSHAFQYTPV